MADRADRLAGLPDAYVLCRAIGHVWEVELGWGWTDAAGVEHRADGWERRHCPRCGMGATRRYDPWFKLLETHYTYPRGYLLNGAGSGPWRQEARAELFTRQAPPRPRERARRQRR